MTSLEKDNLLTVVVLVHQHDDLLASCLEALGQFPIVLKLKTKALITDFAAARNKALSQVITPWVFFVDSDEVVPEGAYEIIIKAILEKEADAFSVFRSDVFFGKKLKFAEWGKQNLVRVLQTKKTYFSGKVHEVPKGFETQKSLPITIEHFAHASVGDFLLSVERYAALRAEEITFSKTTLILQLLIYPAGKFTWNMIFLFGVLDGWRGLVCASVMSYHSAMVRIFALGNILQNEK